MKKLFIYSFSVLMLAGFASCKSTESAYKKAYEQAKQQEPVQEEEVIERVEVKSFQPVVAAPVKAQQVKPEAGVRQEKVTVVSGADGLKKYSVIAGSFGVKSNAENLRKFLDNNGYSSTVVYNSDLNMYRVAVSSFDDRSSAERARDSFKAKYPNRKDFQGAWLLYRL